jgi:hypothetical protein
MVYVMNSKKEGMKCGEALNVRIRRVGSMLTLYKSLWYPPIQRGNKLYLVS